MNAKLRVAGFIALGALTGVALRKLSARAEECWVDIQTLMTRRGAIQTRRDDLDRLRVGVREGGAAGAPRQRLDPQRTAAGEGIEHPGPIDGSEAVEGVEDGLSHPVRRWSGPGARRHVDAPPSGGPRHDPKRTPGGGRPGGGRRPPGARRRLGPAHGTSATRRALSSQSQRASSWLRAWREAGQRRPCDQ